MLRGLLQAERVRARRGSSQYRNFNDRTVRRKALHALQLALFLSL